MRTRLLLFPLLAALASCASFKPQALPVCDGKHRRPANPYGSILAPTAPQSPSAAVPAAPRPASEPQKQSALPAAVGSCAQ